jgi:multidrug efflux pump subunit AcrA (membrane-fusion protein)
VSQREVTVGSREGDRVVVTSGIATGERIVIAGVHSLTAGQQVVVPQ